LLKRVPLGESPWNTMMKRRKSRRDDRYCHCVVSYRPFGTENHLCISYHGLTPVATTCRHIRGSNAGSHRPDVPFIHPVFWRKNPSWRWGEGTFAKLSTASSLTALSRMACPPAKSLNTLAAQRAYCLETMWNTDGSRRRVGAL